MEPAINANLSSDVDLTLAHFSDLGWVLVPTGIGDDRVPDTGVPGVALLPNYPNPFNPSTTIRYEVAESQPIQLAIYDVQGRLVRSLVNRVEPSGVRQVTWQGRGRDGNAVSSGIYFVRLTGEGQTVTRKIVLIK
jgi:hypothetical protein